MAVDLESEPIAARLQSNLVGTTNLKKESQPLDDYEPSTLIRRGAAQFSVGPG